MPVVAEGPIRHLRRVALIPVATQLSALLVSAVGAALLTAHAAPSRRERCGERRLGLWVFPDVRPLSIGDPHRMNVLVVYASRHGATEGIAARIAKRLTDSGVAVELRRVDQVEALDAYDTVVLGAPVYDQSWPPEAARFVHRHRDALAARPLWLFSVGSFGDTKRLIGPLTHKEPKDIAQICAAIRPREYRVFQGVIRKHQWPFWSRLLFHAFGGRFGDHRDWPAIDAWADHIALTPPTLRSTTAA
jgi:menaquinone-dependent protoporphyrinogen oxidase